MLWLLNAFDLAFTILAHRIGGFKELNPVAAPLLHPSWALITFKLAAVALSSVILLLLRRHRITELVCWLLCAVYTALSFSWMAYFTIIR